jgi:hypothetical protein
MLTHTRTMFAAPRRSPTIVGVAPGQRVTTHVHLPKRGDLTGAEPTLVVRVDGRVVAGFGIKGWPERKVARVGALAQRLSPEVLLGLVES